MHGRIFAIEEFSTFDGPGIRCTVFLKGCPLRCQWCHNPEGQSFAPQVIRATAGCIHCGSCVRSGMTLQSIPLCPQGLLRRCGEDLTAAQLLDRLSSRLEILKQVDGGITFSGGEPTAQPGFLLECLQTFQPRIHTALQTCGHCEPEQFARFIRHTHYVLYDLKLMDSGLHRHYTGVDNHWILKNYATLAASDVPFITRIPLIPGVNDTVENITQTARFMAGLGVNKIELLPYNTAAGAKYASTNRSYQIDFDEKRAPEPHVEIFNNYQIEVSVL